MASVDGGTAPVVLRPRPLRALARMQVELAWNRARRESGAGGIAAAAFVVVVVVFALLPPILGSLLVGHALGGVFDDPDSSEALRGAAAFHTFLVWFFGLVGVIGAGRPRFTDPRFRVYPISRRALLTAELCGSLLDFVPLLGMGCFAGLLCGMALAQPGIALMTAPIVALGAVSLLLVYQAAGAVQRLLLKRPRVAITLAGCALFAGALLWVRGSDGETVALLSAAFERFLTLQPSTSAWSLLHEFVSEDGVEFDNIAGRLLALPLAVAGGGVLVVRLLRFESDTEPHHWRRPPVAGGERLWSFGRPAAGIARLFFTQVLGQARGRFLLMAPPIGVTALAIGSRVLPAVLPELAAEPGPIRTLVDIADQPVIAWYSAVALALSGDIWANQFGGDGHGIKTLFGLPVPMREIVLGKLFGVGRIALLQTLMSLPALAFIGNPGPGDLVHGLASGAVALIVLCALGVLISARFPNRATGAHGESQATPLVRLVLPMAAILLLAELLVGTEFVARLLHPAAPPVAMVVLLLAVVGGYWLLLPTLTERVAAQQERLVEELS